MKHKYTSINVSIKEKIKYYKDSNVRVKKNFIIRFYNNTHIIWIEISQHPRFRALKNIKMWHFLNQRISMLFNPLPTELKKKLTLNFRKTAVFSLFSTDNNPPNSENPKKRHRIYNQIIVHRYEYKLNCQVIRKLNWYNNLILYLPHLELVVVYAWLEMETKNIWLLELPSGDKGLMKLICPLYNQSVNFQSCIQ